MKLKNNIAMSKFIVGFTVCLGILYIIPFLVFISAKSEGVRKTAKPNINMCCFFLHKNWEPKWNCGLHMLSTKKLKIPLRKLCNKEITRLNISSGNNAFKEFDDEELLLTIFKHYCYNEMISQAIWLEDTTFKGDTIAWDKLKERGFLLVDTIKIYLHAYLSKDPKAVVYWFYEDAILSENLQGCQITYIERLDIEHRFVVLYANVVMDYHGVVSDFLEDYWKYLKRMIAR